MVGRNKFFLNFGFNGFSTKNIFQFRSLMSDVKFRKNFKEFLRSFMSGRDGSR